MNIGLGCITQADIRFVGGYSPWFSSLPFLNINSMLNFKHLFLVSVALWSAVGMVRAQEFDPKQSYEIHTQNGLVLDNQESLVLLRGQKPLKLYKITPDEHPSFQRLHDVKVSDYTPEWRRQEELAKAERKARAKSRPAPSAPEAGPPPAQPANTAPATPGQKEAGGETAPHKERDQILRQEYDYGLLDPELDRVSSQSPDTEAPYGAFDLIETSPDEVGGP